MLWLCPVQFRAVTWTVELPPRATDGGANWILEMLIVPEQDAVVSTLRPPHPALLEETETTPTTTSTSEAEKNRVRFLLMCTVTSATTVTRLNAACVDSARVIASAWRKVVGQ